MTGLWVNQMDEEHLFVLYEDFKTRQIIGFMKFRGNTVAEIFGVREQDHSYNLTKHFFEGHKQIDVTAKLHTNFSQIHLVQINGPKSWDLTLRNKRDIPSQLFHELVCSLTRSPALCLTVYIHAIYDELLAASIYRNN